MIDALSAAGSARADVIAAITRAVATTSLMHRRNNAPPCRTRNHPSTSDMEGAIARVLEQVIGRIRVFLCPNCSAGELKASEDSNSGNRSSLGPRLGVRTRPSVSMTASRRCNDAVGSTTYIRHGVGASECGRLICSRLVRHWLLIERSA
jgi:hypothetical protein